MSLKLYMEKIIRLFHVCIPIVILIVVIISCVYGFKNCATKRYGRNKENVF